MKKTILLVALATLTTAVFAQKKTTTSATVAFDATTPKDAFPKAENKTTIAVIDTKTGAVAFESLVKNFAFPNEKIQEHFNGDHWLNSDVFPKFSFKGKIADLSKIDFAKDGSYTVTISGNLTVKEATKPVSTSATIVVDAAVLKATASFSIVLADFGITGAPIEGGKVAAEPKITVSAELK